MAFTEITYEVADRIATITLNRPEKRNAWSPVTEAEVREAFGLIAADDDVRAVILTGAGSTFCVGADVTGIAGRKPDRPPFTGVTPPPGDPPPVEDLSRRYSYILNIGKPVIAAINGAVAGVGLAVTMYCDVRFMAAGAKLACAFPRRGLIAEHGIAWTLPRAIGPMNAADLLLSGRTITAEEAAAMGLVRALPADGFAATVRAYVADIVGNCSPRSLRIIRRQLALAPLQSLSEAIELAETEQAATIGTEDRREGAAAFLEKRRPSFTGR
ncbi:enoyl-CoA hydratase [Roseomonas sp. JC162]|uniref:Enoyl-CoA hydratase n=1 Tax=Neoroseomonas marina TaxID=1232220 RepID=A0A848EKI9_9PROT|nr:enoyl-CoA hydratase-related protein [Neoroseomonas marina]NMJ43920.1 enoyl-CoA hydratase [Neoroseomonas marina]